MIFQQACTKQIKCNERHNELRASQLIDHYNFKQYLIQFDYLLCTYAGRINDPSGANGALFRTHDNKTQLADYILFEQYKPGRYLQLQKTAGKFRIAEIEMTFAEMCT